MASEPARHLRLSKWTFVFTMLFCINSASAQLNKSIESSQFGFCLGKWDLYTNGALFGESTVDTLLDGFVIQEDFVEFPPDPFHGLNLTTYNTDSKLWEQTMVDNQGHHSLFIGEFKDGAMIFLRYFKNKKGEPRIQRTKFYNISQETFDWTFDASSDGGKTWNLYYQVNYKRKK
jgi:hypothetical protein